MTKIAGKDYREMKPAEYIPLQIATH